MIVEAMHSTFSFYRYISGCRTVIRWSHTCIAAIVMVLVWPAMASAADEYPNRPLRLIAPFPPGGPTDALARLIATGFTQRWGRQVVVDNRPGEGGNIGSEIAARAAADGVFRLR